MTDLGVSFRRPLTTLACRAKGRRAAVGVFVRGESGLANAGAEVGRGGR